MRLSLHLAEFKAPFFFSFRTAGKSANIWNPVNWADFILKSPWGPGPRPPAAKTMEPVEVISPFQLLCELFTSPSTRLFLAPRTFFSNTGHPVQGPTLAPNHQLGQRLPKQSQAGMTIPCTGTCNPPHAYFLLCCCYHCWTLHSLKPLLIDHMWSLAHRYSL